MDLKKSTMKKLIDLLLEDIECASPTRSTANNVIEIVPSKRLEGRWEVYTGESRAYECADLKAAIEYAVRQWSRYPFTEITVITPEAEGVESRRISIKSRTADEAQRDVQKNCDDCGDAD
jgi:hypothetical protein